MSSTGKLKSPGRSVEVKIGATQTEALTANGEKLLERASQFVTAHPIQSLGLALAAAYLISRLTR